MSITKYFLATCSLVLFSSLTMAQGIKIQGLILDAVDKNPQAGVSVSLVRAVDDTKHYSVTNEKGRFNFNNIPPGTYQLTTTYLGHLPIEKTVEVKNENIDLGALLQKADESLLRELVVKEKQTTVEQIGDTTQYNADAYKTNRNANVEDLVTKMPGITIENGVVKVQGEDLQRVTIDGEDFFGDDATLALRNLPAEIVKKIQVFDQLSEQSQFTGFDDGNTQKTLNIVTKSGKSNGQFGKIYAGYGSDDRYIGGANINHFKNKQRISLVALSNNINQQNFSTQDLLGVTGTSSGGGRGRGGRGGRGGGQGGSANDFLVGQQAGISQVNSVGLNYSNRWGEKTRVNAAYFFNNNSNANLSQLSREYFLNQASNQLYDESNQSQSDNYNHRFNMRLEYKIDEANSISFRPRLSFQDNKLTSNFLGQNYYAIEDPINRSTNFSNNERSGYSFSNDFLYRHRFKKERRTISLNINTSLNDQSGNNYQLAQNEYFSLTDTSETLDQFAESKSKGFSLSPRLSYTEPVGKNGQLEFNYQPSFNNSDADKETNALDSLTNDYTLLEPQLSNQFNNKLNRHRAGTSYQIRKGKSRFSVGLDFEQTNLVSKQATPIAFAIDKTFRNVLPNISYSYRSSKSENLRIQYRSSTDAPNANQLQSVVNNSNSLLLSTGNPFLRQAFSHRFSVRYNKTNAKKASSFFTYLSLGKTDHYIGSSTLIANQDTVVFDGIQLLAGSQLSRPVNLDGYWNMRSYVSYGLPISVIKCNLNLNAGFTFLKNPSIINQQENLVNTYGTNTGVALSSNISEKVDFTLSYNANFNIVDNSLQPDLNNNYFYHNTGMKVNWEFLNRVTLSSDLNQTLYKGLGEGFNQQYWLWNAAIGYRMLKNEALEIRLGVFDLLNQNNSIGRNVSETYVEDTVTNVLQRYVMLSAIYSIRNFGG